MSVKAREVQNYPGSPKKPARAAYEAGRAILALAMSPARAAALSGQVYVKWDFPRPLEMSLNWDFRHFSTLFVDFQRARKPHFRALFRAETVLSCAIFCINMHFSHNMQGGC